MQSLPLQVPILTTDDFEPYCIFKAVKTLGYLENAINGVFNTIFNRIREEQNKVSLISERISKCQEVVHGLNDSSTAITILSPPKFVGSEHPPPYRPISQFIPKQIPEHISGNSVIVNEALSNTSYYEDSQFKFVNPPIVQKSHLQSGRIGCSPEHIHSISSLLIFNSNENPYNNTFLSNNFEQIKQIESSASIFIPDPPISIVRHESLPHLDDILPKIKLDDSFLSELNLPKNIPILENIVDFEIEFDFGNQPSSIPSLEENPVPEFSLPKHPSFDDNSSNEIQNTPLNNSTETTGIPSIPPPAVIVIQKQISSDSPNLNPSPETSPFSISTHQHSHSEIPPSSNNISDDNLSNHKPAQTSSNVSHLDLIQQGAFKLNKLPPPNQIVKPIPNDPNDMASILWEISKRRSLYEVSISSENESESSDSDDD